MRQYNQTRRQARVIAATDEQQALMRGVVHGVILSSGIWAAAIYLASILH